MGEYTKEMHEAYRQEQDEKAVREAEEQRERMEKESARRAWLSDGGREADFDATSHRARDEKPGSVRAISPAGGFPSTGNAAKSRRLVIYPRTYTPDIQGVGVEVVRRRPGCGALDGALRPQEAPPATVELGEGNGRRPSHGGHVTERR